MLVPMRCILETTEQFGYACGAFNVNAVCQAEAAVRVHEIFHAPAILQGADLANGFMGGRKDFLNATLEDKRKGAANIASAVRKLAQDSPVPVALHLDHGRDFDSVKAAVDAGYTSVMIDGSSLPLEENIELTREVVKYAHRRGVTVEGELGVLAGVEDHVYYVVAVSQVVVEGYGHAVLQPGRSEVLPIAARQHGNRVVQTRGKCSMAHQNHILHLLFPLYFFSSIFS